MGGYKNILIVDDDEMIISQLVEGLSDKYRCHPVDNVDEAEYKIDALGFLDLIITGYQVGERLGTDLCNKDIPVILISGMISDEDLMHHMYHCSMLRLFIPKPFTIVELRNSVAHVLADIDSY